MTNVRVCAGTFSSPAGPRRLSTSWLHRARRRVLWPSVKTEREREREREINMHVLELGGLTSANKVTAGQN